MVKIFMHDMQNPNRSLGLEEVTLTDVLNDYEQVYTFPESFTHGKNDRVLCNDIFRILNINHPADYNNRSLSVGDVILIERDTERTYYAVATLGFDLVRK